MLAYISSPLDRDHTLRLQSGALADLAKRPETCVVGVRGDALEARDGALVLQPRETVAPTVYLGRDGAGVAWFAGQASAEATLEPLRGLMLGGQVSADVLSVLAQARSLVHWHERHGFCAHCGCATVIADAGYRRHCAACGSDHFPRTDPVVIAAVRHGGKMLLGRQASWPEGMFSTLAGFVEPGETLEQAVRREVYEEAGVRVGALRYVACQPWPFPASLMVGFVGEALDDALAVDTSELQAARWFSLEETKAMLTRSHRDGLHASHPYAIAHHLISTLVAEMDASG